MLAAAGCEIEDSNIKSELRVQSSDRIHFSPFHFFPPFLPVYRSVDYLSKFKLNDRRETFDGRNEEIAWRSRTVRLLPSIQNSHGLGQKENQCHGKAVLVAVLAMTNGCELSSCQCGRICNRCQCNV
jgi:hypothetical protein